MGVLNKLKHFLPLHTKLTIYNALVLPHINYGLLAWGFKCDKISKLQKKIIRCITCSKYNAHTEPIFKELKLLKVTDIFTLTKLKFAHKYINDNLPYAHMKIPYLIKIKHSGRFLINRVYSTLAQQTLKYSIPKLLNSMPTLITDKLSTHSINGFSNYVKNYFLKYYKMDCSIVNCYICTNNR